MDEQTILANVENLSAEQLFQFINEGRVSLESIIATGRLVLDKKQKIRQLMDSMNLEDDKAWESAKYGNETSIRDYISKWPNGKHIIDAKNEIDKLRRKIEEKERERNNVISKIKNNEITPDRVKLYLNDGVIDENDLLGVCMLPNEIITRIKNYNPNYGEDILGPTPVEIPHGFTEVYFWGIPGSGKTCALSTILNTAHKKGYMKTGEGAGLKYLYTLKNLYKDDDVGLLLENTPDKTQYLPFELKKEKERDSRSVSLIELSGEVFKCFCKKNVGEELEPILENTFQTLNGYLKNNNRKIHYFFIDYTPTSIEQDAYTQSDYLQEAANYFNKNKIFSKNTDSIYLVITKADLIEGYGNDQEKLYENINKFIDNNFKAFDVFLKNTCKKLSINAGKYDIIAFSIGDVYCKRICKINRKPAEIIIDTLFEKIPLQSKSIFDFLNK